MYSTRILCDGTFDRLSLGSSSFMELLRPQRVDDTEARVLLYIYVFSKIVHSIDISLAIDIHLQ